MPLICLQDVLASEGDTGGPGQFTVIPLLPQIALAPSWPLWIRSCMNNTSISAPGSCWGAELNLEGAPSAFETWVTRSRSFAHFSLYLLRIYHFPSTVSPGMEGNSCFALGEFLV